MAKRYKKQTEHTDYSAIQPLCQIEMEENDNAPHVYIPMETVISSEATASQEQNTDTPNRISVTPIVAQNDDQQHEKSTSAPRHTYGTKKLRSKSFNGVDHRNRGTPFGRTFEVTTNVRRRAFSLKPEQDLFITDELQKHLNTLLLEAIDNHNNKEVERLLQVGANPNATYTRDFMSACHVAAYINNGDALNLLLEYNADKTSRNIVGFTPLHFAAWAGNNWAIAILLGFPKDLQKKVTSRMTPKIEEELIELRSRTNFNIIDIPCGENRFNYIFEDFVPKAQRTSVDKTNFRYVLTWDVPETTPLHVACYKAHPNATRLLLAAGAKPNSSNAEGMSPLDMVGMAYYKDQQEFSEDNYVKTIHALNKFGGKFSKAFNGCAIMMAVELCSAKAIKELLAMGANIAFINGRGNTLLHECVEKLCVETLQILANHTRPGQTYKSVDWPNESGQTVLHAAILASWLPGVCVALDAGADVTIEERNGNTPIHLAAASGNKDILKKVLDAIKFRNLQSAVNIDNNRIETPILCAIRSGNLDCVKAIVKSGGSLKITKFDTKINVDQNLPFLQIKKYSRLDPNKFIIIKDGTEEFGHFILPQSKRERNPFNMIIHATAEIGNVDILKFLLQQGIEIRKLLYYRYTCIMNMIPLEFAAFHNRFDNFMLLLEETIQHEYFGYKTFDLSRLLDIIACLNREEMYRKLMSIFPDAVRFATKNGHCPLHNAIKYSNRNVIQHMIDNGADLSQLDEMGHTAISLLVEHVTEPTDFIADIFDCYIKTNNIPIQNRECEITVDYKVLIPPEAPSTNKGDMRVLKALLECDNRKNQRKLLAHPLVESFLYLKWKTLSNYFYTVFFLYILLVVLLSWYIVLVSYCKDEKECLSVPPIWTIHLFLGIVVFQELLSFNVDFKAWTKRIGVQFGLNCLTYIFAIAITIKSADTEEWRHLATITLVLAWLNIMMLLSKIPLTGYYIQMFWKVSLKIIKILCTFLFLIIVFSFCFMIQYHSKVPFNGPISAILRTFVMMTSEFEYDSNFSEEKAESISALVIVIRVIFVVFVILAAIVLMNLMTGVAVNDVQYLVQYGNLRRLEQQVEFLDKLDVSRGKKTLYHKFRLYERFNWKRVPEKVKIKPFNDNKCCFEGNIKKLIQDKAQEQLNKTEKQVESIKKESKLDEILQAITLKEQNIINIESKLDEIFQTVATKELIHKNELNFKKILQAVTMNEQNIIKNESKLDEILQAVTTKEQNKLRKKQNWTRSLKLLRQRNKVL